MLSATPGDEIEQSFDRLAITLQTISSATTAAPNAQIISSASIPATQTPAPTPLATPSPKIPFPDPPAFLIYLHLDWLKTGHIIGYFWLGLTVLHALSASSRWPPGVALLLCSLYAVTDEFHQSFVPGRTASVRDVLLDTLAALIGVAVLLGVTALRKYFKIRYW